jgi:hypothetical protein
VSGNVLTAKSSKVLVLMDDKAADAQAQAIADVYTGKLGGPLADLAQLVGEIIGLERVPIRTKCVEARASSTPAFALGYRHGLFCSLLWSLLVFAHPWWLPSAFSGV